MLLNGSPDTPLPPTQNSTPEGRKSNSINMKNKQGYMYGVYVACPQMFANWYHFSRADTVKYLIFIGIYFCGFTLKIGLSVCMMDEWTDVIIMVMELILAAFNFRSKLLTAKSAKISSMRRFVLYSIDTIKLV